MLNSKPLPNSHQNQTKKLPPWWIRAFWFTMSLINNLTGTQDKYDPNNLPSAKVTLAIMILIVGVVSLILYLIISSGV